MNNYKKALIYLMQQKADFIDSIVPGKGTLYFNELDEQAINKWSWWRSRRVWKKIENYIDLLYFDSTRVDPSKVCPFCVYVVMYGGCSCLYCSYERNREGLNDMKGDCNLTNSVYLHIVESIEQEVPGFYFMFSHYREWVFNIKKKGFIK